MNKILAFLFFLFTFSMFSQNEEYLKHKIVKGETVNEIAKKYKVTPFDIFKLNPDAKEGIKENDTLLIKKIATTTGKKTTNLVDYKVQPKETLYAIARKFEVSVNQIKEWNPNLDPDKIKEGQIIKMGTKNKPIEKNVPKVEDKQEVKEQPKPQLKSDKDKYIIQKGDTKYSISNKFNLTEEELVALNPILNEGFNEGLEIIILKGAIKNNETKKVLPANTKEYTVQKGESIFGICQDYDLTPEELQSLNPELKEGLKEGMILILPNTEKNRTITFKPESKKGTLKVNKSSEEKTLVLFLPFNLSKIEADTTKNYRQYIKTSTALNVSLDYYAGSLLAIDSLKRMGFPIKVKVVDSELSTNNASIISILEKNDFSKVDAVIGPLHNGPIEQTAEYLSKYNIPVISPISIQHGKPISNLYYAMPSDDMKMSKLIEFVKSNNGNIVAIIDSKRKSTREKLSKYSEIKIVPLTEKGGVNSENVIGTLDSSKKNYILVDSERAGFVSNATSIIANLKAKYNTQMVVLETNDALDFEELPIKRLTSIKMMYPTILRNNNSGYYKSFAKKFKNANNTLPNKFASRGFDVTFDTVLRMYQPSGFENSTSEASEQLESKFNYIKIDGGNYNSGVYFLYYDDDLTIKQAQ